MVLTAVQKRALKERQSAGRSEGKSAGRSEGKSSSDTFTTGSDSRSKSGSGGSFSDRSDRSDSKSRDRSDDIEYISEKKIIFSDLLLDHISNCTKNGVIYFHNDKWTFDYKGTKLFM